MERELHCSTCDAVLPPGAQKCPSCGLQLVAQVAPAVYMEGPRFSLLAVVVAAGALMIILYIADHLKH